MLVHMGLLILYTGQLLVHTGTVSADIWGKELLVHTGPLIVQAHRMILYTGQLSVYAGTVSADIWGKELLVHTGPLIVQAHRTVLVYTRTFKCRQMGKGVVSAHRTINSAGTGQCWCTQEH